MPTQPVCAVLENISRKEAIDILYIIQIPLDYTLRVKLNSLGSGVSISPLVAFVSIELHSLRLGSRVGNS